MTRLRLRLIEDMQVRNLSPRTQCTYVRQVAQFSRHFGKSPDLLGPAEIRAWQVHLAQDKRLAARSITVAVSALRFFYTATLRRSWALEDDIPAGRQAKKLPVVLSRDEVARFLGTVDNLKHRMILPVCYASGLRISEAARRKPAAIAWSFGLNKATVGKTAMSCCRPNSSTCSGSIGSALIPVSGCFPVGSRGSRFRRPLPNSPAAR